MYHKQQAREEMFILRGTSVSLRIHQPQRSVWSVSLVRRIVQRSLSLKLLLKTILIWMNGRWRK